MKKVTIVLLAVFILATSCFCSACNKTDNLNEIGIETEKISLTKSNYKDYLAINTAISSCFYEKTSKGYFLYAQLNINVAPKGSYTFNDCKIQFALGVQLATSLVYQWQTNGDRAICELDINGNALSSLSLSSKEVSTIYFPCGSPDNVTVLEISGSVNVPKE